MTGNRHRPIVPAASRRRALIALAALATSGCGYSFRAPYDKSVQTVYVPMFKSQTFTRDVEKMLTELVQKEIGRRTPYRLVDDVENADTPDAKFTFRGEPKPAMVPEVALLAEGSGPSDGTAAAAE